MSAFRVAALEAAQRGWAVFPLKPRDKVPATAHGCKDAAKRVPQIEAWWDVRPDANVGLATGPESGVWVLDIDGEEGAASLTDLVKSHGPLPLTARQSTGKGEHYLFRWPASNEDVRNSARRLGPGLDVRGRGGYIVLAPSIHPSGRAYEWRHHPDTCGIANAPGWLLDLVIPPKVEPKPRAPVAPRNGVREGNATRYGERALDSACARIAGALPGTQNTVLTSEAAAIGELVAGGEIARGYAERALINAGLAMACSGKPWLEVEIAKKVAWGFDVGVMNPRSVARDTTQRYESRADKFELERRADIARVRPEGRGTLLIAPPDSTAVLIVAAAAYAEAAALAWEQANGAPYGLYAPRDFATMVGGLTPNAGGYPNWSKPSPDLRQPAATMRWRGRVLLVLPSDLQSFTVSPNTRFERFISVERHAQVAAMIATHWWKQAGASDVQVAVLPDQMESAA